MPSLPDVTDFNEMSYPELTAIFRQIDLGIAAIVASDPAFRPKPPHKRRSRTAATAGAKRRPARRQQAAA